MPPVHQRRQRHLRGDGLVVVGHECPEAVVADGDPTVGVAGDDGELHGGGDLGRRGSDVEGVDCGRGDGELRLVGAVDEPEGEGGGAEEEEEDGKTSAEGSVGVAGFVVA